MASHVTHTIFIGGGGGLHSETGYYFTKVTINKVFIFIALISDGQ